jgi:hypothetical protein
LSFVPSSKVTAQTPSSDAPVRARRAKSLAVANS